MTVFTHPEDVERTRRERARRLATWELPLTRVVGSLILALAVFLHNSYLIDGQRPDAAIWVALLLGGYAAVAWLAAVIGFQLRPPRDVTLFFFAGDLLIWTVAIYATGAERSWLFFILLMRIADQTQTTVRRCLGFATLAAVCWLGMVAYVGLVDGRPISMSAALVKTVFITLAGIYIALAAKTAESRRAQLTSAIRMSRDLIRQLEQQSNELRDARARAEEASAAKSEFLANMSHEMRTPLHGVIGMLQLGIEDEASAQRARRLEMARRSAEALLGTIDDILDFAKIEARKIDLEPVYFSLRDLLTDTMKALGVTASARGLVLAYWVDNDVPDSVWGDPVRLRQVLINLVGNSIKFTPTGEIVVRVDRFGDRVRFDVSDTGIGIDAAMRDKIFQPFTQADSSHARRVGGTGLGLAIVARLVEAMGGGVNVASQPGRGSSFSFTIPLPADPIAAAPRRSAWESELTGKSVLIVDPIDTSRAFIAQILRSRGIFATACASAAEAPEGRYACAVTADAAVTIEPRVFVSSPLEHADDDGLRITRPVAERELIEAVGQAVGVAPEAPAYTLHRRASGERGLRVLLAEDDPVGREFAAEALKRLGHEVSLASDGEVALACLMASDYDVAVMDVQMPALDGLEVTRRYREAGGRVPIIAVTAHTRKEDREACLAAGMNAVLTKPIDRRQIQEVLVDVTGAGAIVDAVGGNAGLLARVSDAFARQTPRILESMRDAMRRADAEALYRAAHKLKGSVANFQDDATINVATELEVAAKTRDLDRAAALLPRMVAAIGELERKIVAAGANLRSRA
jgi:signal transduction histidine kinase/CheY-like chemotaxis protein